MYLYGYGLASSCKDSSSLTPAKVEGKELGKEVEKLGVSSLLPSIIMDTDDLFKLTLNLEKGERKKIEKRKEEVLL